MTTPYCLDSANERFKNKDKKFAEHGIAVYHLHELILQLCDLLFERLVLSDSSRDGRPFAL